jgi:hypothetical protein
MSDWFTLDASELDKLQDAMQKYEGHAGVVVDEVLHGEGAELIKQRIAPLIPSSGRTWAKKGAAASAVMPGKFAQDNGTLSVTIAARGKYHYLYFPDDGSNTKRHAGNQQFMMHGAEDASSDVIDLCIGKLTESF